MNDEYDPMAIVEEVMGPDEDDDEGISAYALNRQKLNESRIFEENRFQNQVQTTKKAIGDFATGVVDDLSTPRGATEFTLDMITDAGILARSFPEDLPTGIAAVAARRGLQKIDYGKLIEDVFNTSFFPKAVTEKV